MKKITQDTVFYQFWNHNEYFADVCNALLYRGAPVIQPHELQEMDSKTAFVLEQEELKRSRDIIKKIAKGIGYMIVGIENQSFVSHTMPVRILLYDGLPYHRELQKEKKAMSASLMNRDEFLSGIKKESRLHPVITIVLYYGKKEWDGPRKLSEMIDPLPKELTTFFQDYCINLFEIRNCGQYSFQNEDVKTVMQICCAMLRKNYEELKKTYGTKKISRHLGQMIAYFLKDRRLLEKINKQEEMTMCTMIDELVMESEQKGFYLGSLQKTKEIIRVMLQKQFSIDAIKEIVHLSEKEIEDMLEKETEEKEECKTL